MLLLNESALKKLNEVEFEVGQGEDDEQPDDYAMPEDGNEEDSTQSNPDSDDYTMDEDSDNGEEPDEGDDTGEEPESGEEEGADNEEDIGEDDTEDTSSPNNAKKKKRLLYLYKKFYNDLTSLSTNIGERISPLNNREEYLYKIIVENIEKNRTLLFEYIENLYNEKDYEENVYQFYFFSSQVEMIHILLRKIQTYRVDNKNNIIKK